MSRYIQEKEQSTCPSFDIWYFGFEVDALSKFVLDKTTSTNNLRFDILLKE